MKNIKPGMGDPYWYEWSIGEEFIIRMLNPDNHIKYVEFQSNVPLGLDDVVVTYENGNTHFIQVKHTMINDSLSFGDMLDGNNVDAKHHLSLLYGLASGWNKIKAQYDKCKIIIVTNKEKGKRASTTKKTGIKRPSLNWFYNELKEQLLVAESIEDICFTDYPEAWEEWMNHIACIESSSDKLSFLRALEIRSDQVNFSEIQEEIIELIKAELGANDNAARIIIQKLDHCLRNWTTTLGFNKKIDAETVLQELSNGSNYNWFNHDLIPANPFFESRIAIVDEIEELLQKKEKKVIFLSGDPGSGKTTVISKLCCKRESLVNIRYYSYEPIDPQSEYLTSDVSLRVKKETFWNELFNQLRFFLKGSLKQYNVPVINELMTLDEMKRKFFKIASEYATANHTTFVLAIDGIDHAARAFNSDETFLSTLPAPEYIPDGVKILIAGQPKDGYAEYPIWMKSKNENVCEVLMPKVSKNDIQGLVDELLQDSKSDNERQMISNLVEQYAQGNTLSAIFAIHESMYVNSILEFESKLQQRKLSGNIQDYYETIWNSAIRVFAPYHFAEYKLAGVFAFFNERVNAKILEAMFSREKISYTTWNNYLKSLRPLLQEKDGYYTVLHNDVRVFLSGIIQTDTDHVKETYIGIGDYYLQQEEKSRGYYYDLLRFIHYSNRVQELYNFLTADFIIEAVANGKDVSELQSDLLVLLKDALSTEKIDWEVIQSISIGLMTVDRIVKSIDEFEEDTLLNQHKYIPYQGIECYIKPENTWNSNTILRVLQLSYDLSCNEEYERGKQLFLGWFEGLSISNIFKILCLGKDDDEDLDIPGEKEIASLFGKLIPIYNRYDLILNDDDLEIISDYFLYHLSDNLCKTIVIKYNKQDFLYHFSKVPYLHFKTIVDVVETLLTENRLDDLKSLSSRLQNVRNNKMFFLLLTFINCILLDSSIDAHDKEERQTVLEEIIIPSDSFEVEAKCYVLQAFILSCLSYYTPFECARVLSKKYKQNHKGACEEYYYSVFSSITYLGDLFAKFRNGTDIRIDKHEIEAVFNNVFIKRWGPNKSSYILKQIYPLVVKGYLYLSTKINKKDFSETIYSICDELFRNYSLLYLSTAFYAYSTDSSKRDEWLQYWIGEEGALWKIENVEKQYDLINILHVCKIYHVNNSLIQQAEKNKKWFVLGYSQHKEYSVHYLLDWYNNLIGFDNNYIKLYAAKLKQLSDEIDCIGDNRANYYVNDKFYSDIFSLGITYYIEKMSCEYYQSECIEYPGYFVSGLIGYIETADLDKKQLLELWAIGIGLLDWRDDSNYGYISDLEKAIQKKAKDQYLNISNEMYAMAPAYMDLILDRFKYHMPERWVNNNSDEKDSSINGATILKDSIREYLTGNLKEYQLKEIMTSVEKSIDFSNDVFREVIQNEINRNQITISNNTLIQYLIEKMDSTKTDQIVRAYLMEKIEKKDEFITDNLRTIILWKSSKLGGEFCKNGIERLFAMHHSWITVAGHFPMPPLLNNGITTEIEWKNLTNIQNFFFQVLKNIILSDDAEAIKIALGGLYLLIQLDENYLSMIEEQWDDFHYKAKEWLLMIYELSLESSLEGDDNILNCVDKHRADQDFNVSLYANILFSNYKGFDDKYIKRQQDYFSEIPSFGYQKIIRTNTDNTQFIDGKQYVAEIIDHLKEMHGYYMDAIEERTMLYSHMNFFFPRLKSLGRKNYEQIVLNKIEYSFYRVLYKEWVTTSIFDDTIIEIARLILSSSEPLITLRTPQRWPYFNGNIITDVDTYMVSNFDEKNLEIKRILKEGISDEEVLIGGSIVNYSADNEIFGYYISYVCPKSMVGEFNDIHVRRNARLLFFDRPDFMEEIVPYIIIRNTGVASFQLSSVDFGFTTIALEIFGWKVALVDNQYKVLNSEGLIIGRLEFYFGNHNDLGYRFPTNQPYCQRWIINKNEYCKAEELIKPSLEIRSITGNYVFPFH